MAGKCYSFLLSDSREIKLEQRAMAIKNFSRYSNSYCLTLWSSLSLLAMLLTRTTTTKISTTDIIINTTATGNNPINTNSTINASDTKTTTAAINIDTTINVSINTTNNINTPSNTTSSPLKLSDMCPGMDYLHGQTNVTVQEVNTQDCENLPDFTSGQGVVHGMCGDSTVYCHVHIEVPHHMFARVTLRRLAYWCEYTWWETCLQVDSYMVSLCIQCGTHSFQNTVFEFFNKHVFLTHLNLPAMIVIIEAIMEHGFIVRYTSGHSGYVLLPARDRYNEKSFDTRISEELKATPGWVIMISYPLFAYEDVYCGVCTELIYTKPNIDDKNVVRWCSEKDKSPRVFPVFHLYINALFSLYDVCEYTQKMVFSFHPETYQPSKFLNGQFNCSVDYYSSFQRHLDCNLKSECEDAQDETDHCPFSSPDCQGLVASHNKCLKYATLSRQLTWPEQKHMCSKLGGLPASIKTRDEQNDFRHLFKTFYSFRVYIGYISGWTSVPVMYSKFQQWFDNTMIYNLNHFVTEQPYTASRVIVGVYLVDMMMTHLTTFFSTDGIVCETQTPAENRKAQPSVRFPQSPTALSIYTHTLQSLWACPSDHITHAFLSCDASSRCGQMAYPQSCVLWDIQRQTPNTTYLHGKAFLSTVSMFECNDNVVTLPYTLLCDFQHDCPDDSDESFCQYLTCRGFLCSNGQCVGYSQYCNGHSDCLDNSDEDECTEHKSINFYHRQADEKTVIIICLDGTGYFTQQVMKLDESCPNTHYRCTGVWLYCLPVYTRCNGFSDCVYGEDEQDCETVMCSGFYQCRASSVCVHGDHLCDGWGQCPQRDDEWLCDTTCPDSCQCQGLSALCRSPFPAYLFPQLRYVDATGSGLTLTNFSANTHLVYLSLSRCSLVDIHAHDVYTANLLFVDLSDNNLKSVNMNTFLQMWNLRILILANNPLSSLIFMSFNVQYTLRKIDLSRTHLDTFNHEKGVHLPQLHSLNLSFSAITTISSTEFRTIPQLIELDVRGNPLGNYQFDLWSGSRCLKTIFASDFRFCCAILPFEQADRKTCSSPRSVLPSCTDLLPTKLHKLFFVMTSVCATLGNMSAIAFLLKQKTFEKKVTAFFLQFQMVKICMGIHTSINIIAHELHSGKYIFFEKTWINSLTCKLAGFLSLLSSEVSVLIIWFLTVDHFFILYCQLTRHRLDQYRTAAVLGVIWSLGIMLSVMPFLPGLSHWGVDDQSGLCRLALFDCYNCHHKFRWFTVTVIFNFILYSMTVAGQSIIFRRTPKYRILLDPSKRSMYSSAHLLVKTALTDTVCCFSLALTTLMAIDDVDELDKIHMVVVVFILPLSSALSPFLYMWSVATQRRQQRQEQKVLQLLKSRLPLSPKDCM